MPFRALSAADVRGALFMGGAFLGYLIFVWFALR
jgi:hypothetical protein